MPKLITVYYPKDIRDGDAVLVVRQRDGPIIDAWVVSNQHKYTASLTKVLLDEAGQAPSETLTYSLHLLELLGLSISAV